MNEEDNFDSVCNIKVVMKKGEEKPPSVYDQWQGNEVNSIQTNNQETTMEHFFDLLDNKDIQFFDEEDIQEDRDQRIDSVRNYKVVPRIDQQEVESLQRFCILQGNQNFLTKNSFPTRSSMRNDSMRNEDTQFNQTQTTIPRR